MPGHYYSFIKDRVTQKWNRFDDTRVTPWDIDSELESDCFGGVQYETITDERGNTRHVESESWCTAYMLFYDRVDVVFPATVAFDKLPGQVSKELADVITDNQAIQEQSVLASKYHSDGLMKLMKLTLRCGDDALVQHMTELASRYFFSFAVRLGDYSLDQFCDMEPEPDDNLDQTIWKFGHILSQLYIKCESSISIRILQDYEQKIKTTFLYCPRGGAEKSANRVGVTREVVIKLLLTCATSSDEAAIAIYHMLIQMVAEINQTKHHYSALVEAYIGVLRIEAVRDYAQRTEGFAYLLSFLFAHKCIDDDEITETMSALTGLKLEPALRLLNPQNLFDAASEMLNPLDNLAEISRSILDDSFGSIVAQMGRKGGPITTANLIIAGLKNDSEARHAISDIIFHNVTTAFEDDRGLALDALSKLVMHAPESTQMVMSELMNKGAELHGEQQDMDGANTEDVEAVWKLMLTLCAISPNAQQWIVDNKEKWSWVGDHLTYWAFESKDTAITSTLTKLMSGAEGITEIPTDLLGEYSQEEELFRGLLEHGDHTIALLFAHHC